MMPFFTTFWETFEEYLFPNAPALRKRRQLRKLERQLRKAGILGRSGKNLSGRWAKSLGDLNQTLEPFRPLFLKTFGSPQAAYRQAVSHRFWEESLGSEFLEAQSKLSLEILKRRYVQSGSSSTEGQKIDREVDLLLAFPMQVDPLPLTQEWNALHWFSELVLFPYETVLHPWMTKGKGAGDYRTGSDPTPLIPALEDLYLVLGAVDPGKNLERAVVRFVSTYIQDEDQIAKVYVQIQKVRALVMGPCHFTHLRDLLRWLQEEPDLQPKIGRQDPLWFRKNSDEFEASLRASVEKARAEAFGVWLDGETRRLFGPVPLLTTVGYGEQENHYLRQTKNPLFSLVRPLEIFKTFFFGPLKKELLPMFRTILLKGTFVDKDLNKNLTQWVYRMEELESEWAYLETDLVEGSTDSWGRLHELLEKTGKSGPVTQRMIEKIDKKVLEFLGQKSQDLINFLEVGVLVEGDRREERGGVQNWKDLSLLDKGSEGILTALPDQAGVIYRLLKVFLPVQSSLLE